MDTTSNLSRCAERRHALQLRMGKGVAIIPTAPERIRNRDSDYLYRFDSYFYYLSGFPEPEAMLVLLAGEEPKSILFCRERSPERELWEGVRNGPEGARAAFGFDEAYPVGSLDEHMPKLLADQPALYYAPGADAGWDGRIMGWLNQVRAQARAGVTAPAEIRDVRTALDDMRLIKDEGVLAVQTAAIARVKPGNRWDDPHDAAVRTLAQGFLDLGLCCGTLEKVIETEDYKRFYMHRTGHWLGLDVHDAGEYKSDGEWRRLEPGMTLTVEPGCYIRPADDVPRQFWNTGVRIEDDVLVTASGCEVLTAAAPKSVRDIEALVGRD